MNGGPEVSRAGPKTERSSREKRDQGMAKRFRYLPRARRASREPRTGAKGVRVKGKDRFPLWVWVVGPTVILVVAVGLMALLREGDPVSPEAGVTFDEVAEEPDQFLGETVTIYGHADVILGPRTFLISRRIAAGDLLVVSPVPLQKVGDQAGGDPPIEDGLSEHDTVWVTGEVVRFDMAGAKQRVGADLDEETLDAYVGTTAIIADSVSLRSPEVFEEEARGASGEG